MKHFIHTIKNLVLSKPSFVLLLAVFISLVAFALAGHADGAYAQVNTNIEVSEGSLGFKIPDLKTILTFAVKFFFILAGLAALGYGLWGAFSWVTSGGESENVEKARNRIVAAIVGLILVVAVLAIMVTFEQFVFQQRVCFGLSCPVTIPGILEGCVPNPQYGVPKTIYNQRTKNNLGDKTKNSIDTECCPDALTAAQKEKGVRITTGWDKNTTKFGNNDYRICCKNGDADGDQICD